MGDDKKNGNSKKPMKIPDVDKMNLRDVFAAVALHQLLGHRIEEEEQEAVLGDSILAYKIANQMLLARQSVPGPREGAHVTLDADSLARLLGHEVEEV
ncbi:MAG: hypothetical protein ACOC0P_00805 [Planctomycetota bacterium]